MNSQGQRAEEDGAKAARLLSLLGNRDHVHVAVFDLADLIEINSGSRQNALEQSRTESILDAAHENRVPGFPGEVTSMSSDVRVRGQQDISVDPFAPNLVGELGTNLILGLRSDLDRPNRDRRLLDSLQTFGQGRRLSAFEVR
ncbi:MAG: hypothetical protein P8Y94_16840 [Acidobacteriota bacterium]